MVVNLSNGIQFDVRAVAAFAVKKKQEALEATRPKVPIVHIAEDDRDVEVPEDPRYQEALQRWQAEMVEATYDTLIILGTKLLNVPEALQRPEQEEWAEDLALVGIPVAEKGKARYLAWVKYYACAENKDMVALIQYVNKAVGVPEEDAAKAAAAFRGGA